MDFKLRLLAFMVASSFLCTEVSAAVNGYSGWNAAPDTQYHIQTDEGDERFFRYQTVNGQYRKEKRLEDGTVIGTSGWVDPNGMLRLNDYIADNKGYRILRTKMVFVGGSEDIGKGVAKAKKVPAHGGTLVNPGVTLLKSVDATPIPSPPTTPAPFTDGPAQTYTYSTPEINTNAIGVVYPHQKAALEAEDRYTTTYSSPYVSTQSASVYPSPTPIYQNPYRPPYMAYQEFGKRINYVNNYDHPAGNNEYNQKFDSTYNQNIIRASASNRQDYATQSLPSYDGISTTKDGFRYYLPRQYHEEIASPSGESRTGSFGYIDPFGIRRVTYYNTDPGTGFVHRKNNRYVGFQATPYDPRF